MAFRSSIETIGSDSEPDIVYLNLDIINGNTVSGQVDPAIRFMETRDSPIIRDASKYQFSIVRFSMDGPGKDLPVFIPQIKTGAANWDNNINRTIYTCSLRVNLSYSVGGVQQQTTLTSSQDILYQPETLSPTEAPIPPASSTQTGQVLVGRYYWVYSISRWLDMVNTTYAACIADLQSQFASWWLAQGGAAPAPQLQTKAPYLTYDPTTQLFALYCDRYGFGGADRSSIGSAADEDMHIFMNANLFYMFANFNNTYIGDPNLTNELAVKSLLWQNVVTVTPPGGTATQYLLMTQDHPSTSTLWNPVGAIVFVSTMLPLVFEQVGHPVKFGSNNVSAPIGTQNGFLPVVTDITIPGDSAFSARDFLAYIPTSEYRMASFLPARTPINSYDVSVYWKNRLTGELLPLTMFNGSSVSMKIMFRKRTE